MWLPYHSLVTHIHISTAETSSFVWKHTFLYSWDAGKMAILGPLSPICQITTCFICQPFARLQCNDYVMVMDTVCQNDHTDTGLQGFHVLLKRTC